MILRLHVAGFAAGTAVVLAVFAETDFVLAAAQPAVSNAGALPLHLVAQKADKFLGHARRIARGISTRKLPTGQTLNYFFLRNKKGVLGDAFLQLLHRLESKITDLLGF